MQSLELTCEALKHTCDSDDSFFKQHSDAIKALNIVLPLKLYQQSPHRGYFKCEDLSKLSCVELIKFNCQDQLRFRAIAIETMQLSDITDDWRRMGQFHPDQSAMLARLIDRGGDWLAVVKLVMTIQSSEIKGCLSNAIPAALQHTYWDSPGFTEANIAAYSDDDLHNVVNEFNQASPLVIQCKEELERRQQAAAVSAAAVSAAAVSAKSTTQTPLEPIIERLILSDYPMDIAFLTKFLTDYNVSEPLRRTIATKYPQLRHLLFTADSSTELRVMCGDLSLL